MERNFDVIVTGGSYAGLQAALTLGRAGKRTLVIDSGAPCNRFTPHAHNFITHDGEAPAAIAITARQQLAPYATVQFLEDKAVTGVKAAHGFEITTAGGQTFRAGKLLFTTGVRDILPDIKGFADCWGKSIIHCPFCHGFEVKGQPTGILGNLEMAFEFSKVILNWTKDLTLFTNGPAALTAEQSAKLQQHHIAVVTAPLQTVLHENGRLQALEDNEGRRYPLQALYTRLPFVQHCDIPAQLGCKLTPEGLIEVNPLGKTSVEGVFAAGDNCKPMRALALAVQGGLGAAATITHDMAAEAF